MSKDRYIKKPSGSLDFSMKARRLRRLEGIEKKYDKLYNLSGETRINRLELRAIRSEIRLDIRALGTDDSIDLGE